MAWTLGGVTLPITTRTKYTFGSGVITISLPGSDKQYNIDMGGIKQGIVVAVKYTTNLSTEFDNLEGLFSSGSQSDITFHDDLLNKNFQVFIKNIDIDYTRKQMGMALITLSRDNPS